MRYKKEEASALEKIYEAVASLIKEKDYSKITNTDIIKESATLKSGSQDTLSSFFVVIV